VSTNDENADIPVRPGLFDEAVAKLSEKDRRIFASLFYKLMTEPVGTGETWTEEERNFRFPEGGSK
jgi:hypothetical protein